MKKNIFLWSIIVALSAFTISLTSCGLLTELLKQHGETVIIENNALVRFENKDTSNSSYIVTLQSEEKENQVVKIPNGQFVLGRGTHADFNISWEETVEITAEDAVKTIMRLFNL